MNVIPYKPTLSNSLIRPLGLLGGGQLIVALAGLAYGKLTAHYISPAVWGQYSLMAAVLPLLQGLLLTPTLQSFKAALSRFGPAETIRFYVRLLLWIGVGLGPLLLLGGWLTDISVTGLVWLVLLSQGVYQLGTDYLNGRGYHRTYTLTQIAYALGNLLAFCLIVIGLGQHNAMGIWLALGVLNGVFAVITAGRLRQAIRGEPALRAVAERRAEQWRTYRQFVSPLLSLAGWNWLINYADRYLIGYYLTDADVGQYVMGYGLGSKLLLLVAPLLAVLTPLVLRLNVDGRPSVAANALLLPYLLRYGLVAGFICLLFYVTRDSVGQALLDESYRRAFGIGPIVAVGYLFLTSIHLLEIKWYAYGTTRFILWHSLVGVVLHLGLNSLLIPRLGLEGAALATLLGFAGQFAVALWLFTSSRFNRPL